MSGPRTAESPPDSLDEAGRVMWTETIAQLRSQSTFALSDLPLIERYVFSLQVSRQARDRVAKNAVEIGDAAYTTPGSQGQLVQHPDLRTAFEADKAASQYATELLLSPRERSRHKVKAGDPARGRLAAVLEATG